MVRSNEAGCYLTSLNGIKNSNHARTGCSYSFAEDEFLCIII